MTIKVHDPNRQEAEADTRFQVVPMPSPTSVITSIWFQLVAAFSRIPHWLGSAARHAQVLKVFPYPITITTFQFLVGAVVVQLMWLFGLYKRPNVTKEQVSGNALE